ncbi:MAG: MFS transporter [Deltaproteobacteria bacterium]|nr:MFS transporter [Deltaproteobacteria bacterium]
MAKRLDTFLESAFRIRPGEGTRAGWMFAYQLAVVAAFIVGRTVRDTLFLSRYRLEQLPWMYVAVAVAVATVSYGYGRLADRIPRERMIVGSLATFPGLLLGAWVLLHLERAGTWLYPSLYVLTEIIGALSMIQFWTFANDIFSSREAKRLFAFIGAGGVVASIACGFLVGGSARQLGASNLVLIVAAFLGLAMFCVRRIAHECRRELAQVAAKRSRSTRARPSERGRLLETRHLRLIGGIVVLTMLTSTLVDYQFKVLARQSYLGHEDGLAAFFGYFYGFAGIISFGVQFLAIGRLLERAGILAALLVLPIGLFTGASAMLLVPLVAPLVAATLAKGAENVFRYTVHDASMQLLYVPIEPRLRARGKAFIDGVLKPLSIGLSGLLILALSRSVSADPSQAARFALDLAWGDLALLAAWIALVFSVRKEYVRSLLGTLRTRRLDFEAPFSFSTDDTTAKALVAALSSSEESELLHALELLRSVEVDLSDRLRPLIAHPSAAIRVASLDLLGKSGRFDHQELIRSRFSDVDPDVRAAAVEAYCAVGGERAIRGAQPFLRDRSALVRGAAVAGMIKHGGLDGVLAAAEALKSLLSDPDPVARARGARVLEEIRVKSFYQPVLTLLADPVVEVQTMAIRAAGAMQSPELVPPLIYKLANPRTARGAVRALAAYGSKLEPLLLKVLRRADEDLEVRRQVPRVLAHSSDADTLRAILDLFEIEDHEVRRQLARAAARIRRRHPDLEIDDERVQAATRREIQAAYQALAIFDDLELDERSLLGEALILRHERRLSLAFRLLSLRYSTRTIEVVYMNLESHDKATRANAVELVDNLLESEEARPLLPLLEDHDTKTTLRAGAELFPLERRSSEAWLANLIDDSDAWVAACAIHLAGERQLRSVAPKIIERLRAANPLVCETACRVLEQLWRNSEPPDRTLVEEALRWSTGPAPEAPAALRAAVESLRSTLTRRMAHG